MARTEAKPLWDGQPEGRWFTRIEVTSMLNGAMLALPLHVVTGRKPGPTLGIVTNTHGDEFLPATAIRTLLDTLDASALSGRLALISVANPLAMANFGRQTPEQHGRTDLHEVYPGNARGNTTQMIAAAITEHVIRQVDALIDFHSGGSGGRLQARVDYNSQAQGEVKRRSLELARAFGQPFVHENEFAGAASHHANSIGTPAFNPEMGGSYLGPENTALYQRQAIDGLNNVMIALGMLPGAAKPPRQIHFDTKARREIRPKQSGYLESFFERTGDLGKRVAAETRLGQVIDLHTLRVIETLTAPVDGYLFFSRYSGVVGSGTQAFAVADAALATWLA
ncbi:MAG: succinylglutamate desuccinylase/aspartoacylase family protein [Burkholderiales bacterium]|nr:succinylglutamate desuccinylase/aspartoacylase family protein [Burkholderiales bacterium]